MTALISFAGGVAAGYALSMLTRPQLEAICAGLADALARLAAAARVGLHRLRTTFFGPGG